MEEEKRLTQEQTPLLDPIAQRYANLEKIKELGHAPYPHRFDFTHTIPEIVASHQATPREELEARKIRVRICGRIVALRGFGKASFAHLSSGGNKVQIYLRKDDVSPPTYELFRQLDIGDFIGAEGYLFRTKTNELTVHIEGLEFLAKSLLPLPEKWHGLTDVEIRYRQRYLDLVVNQESREVFVKRSRIIQELRRYFDERGYIEVETPMMQPMAGGATARPFVTYHHALDLNLYLRIAPELYLKRLIVGQLERVYEINRNFRNEGISTQHNPEFTMLEFYQSYSDYRDLMALTEELFKGLAMKILGTLELEFDGQKISLAEWKRFTIPESIRAYWPESLIPVPSLEDLNGLETLKCVTARWNAYAAGSGQETVAEQFPSAGELQGALFEAVVEHHLIQPTIIYDYPIELSPLSKSRADDPSRVERFELYIGGMEIANAYSELNDPAEQKRRFEMQMAARERGDEEAHQMDEDYLRALRYGMPPTAGEGIGIDRLTMLFANCRSIRDVILFPHMRPEVRDAS
jgi:lysyl-tRNA synthetase class 2